MRKNTRAPRLPWYVVVAAPAALLLAVEIAARLLVPLDALVYRDSSDPFLRFELLPGASGQKDGVEVSINSAGQRGPELAPKAPGAQRVAFVGGHETFGLGVALEDAYLTRAAAGASEDRKAPVEAVNLSMYSYTLGQKVRLACARLAGLEADAVVLQISDDDTRALPDAGLNAPALKNALRRSSTAVRVVAERRYWRRVQAGASEEARAPLPDSVPEEVGRRETALADEQLAAYKRCLDEAGVRGGIVLVPNLSMTPERLPVEVAAFRAAVKKRAKELGLEFEDAGPGLRRLSPAEALKRANEPVLAPAGHRALAESVRALLKRMTPRKQPPTRPSA